MNLGVVQENPASVSGVITIMEHLARYVPNVDGTVFSIPIHGNQLSIERMVDAKLCRVDANSSLDRFEGFEPSPQEFHKRGILLQVL